MIAPAAKSKPAAPSAPPAVAETNRQVQLRNTRETIESIAIAFILAFLFRTFEAEAFVIPTGSMAPTLQGRHKDIECPQCGYRYQVGASSEIEDNSVRQMNADLQHVRERDEQLRAQGRPSDQEKEMRWRIRQFEVTRGTCPMCRYTARLGDPEPDDDPTDPETPWAEEQISYNGDRIVVAKFLYEFADPQRWDVIVFKYPGDAKMNYIKRLVGLPEEELQIQFGDIFTRPLAADDSPDAKDRPFAIARKPADKVLSMLQAVDDSRYIPLAWSAKDWPLRWRIEPGQAGAWQEARETDESGERPKVRQTFSIAAGGTEPAWLRYRNYIPDDADWARLKNSQPLAGPPPNPQLITDFYAYNTFLSRNQVQAGANGPAELSRTKAGRRGIHWVGDLAVEGEIQIESSTGQVLLDLIEGGVHFQASIDVASGEAVLTSDALPDFRRTGATAVRGPGRYKLTFANVDDQLLLWVDRRLVKFDQPAEFAGLNNHVPQPADLAPAGIGSLGAALRVERLRVLRDVYYIAQNESGSGEAMTDYPGGGEVRPNHMEEDELREFLSNPSRWDVFGRRRAVRFTMEADQFFAMGDNSPQSKDSRLWPTDRLPGGGGRVEHFVDRKLLIGKALFIYWPHSWERVPGTTIPFPFFPNFNDMKLVR